MKFFVSDVSPLLHYDSLDGFSLDEAKEFVEQLLFPLFPGNSWKMKDK